MRNGQVLVERNVCLNILTLAFYLQMFLSRHGKTGGLGWVNRIVGQNGSHVKTGQSGCGSNGSRVESGYESSQVDPYFSKKIFFFFLK